MSKPYTVQRFKGEFALIFYVNGKRRRFKLDTADPREAEIVAPALYAELTRPKGKTVAELWSAYDTANADKAIITRRNSSWKVLRSRFADMEGDRIALQDCDAHIEERRKTEAADGTLHTELGHLRTTLNWAVKQGLLPRAAWIKRPPQPKPREEYLTKEQCRKLIDSATADHVRLFIILALATGGRNAALLGLKWARCDFQKDLIDLRDPDITTAHKRRAIVPMNTMLKEALLAAHKKARSEYVIEWGGEEVASVKRGLKSSAAAAGLGNVWPHLLRHSAAVHMAEASVSMDEIAQYLGHTDVNVTRNTYARYSPEHLRKAASALEY